MSSISYIQCFIDGAVRNNGMANPLAACAAVIYDKKKEVLRFSRVLGVTTNNAAEYEALIHTLIIAQTAGYERPLIYSDSALVVNHTNGGWECKTESLLPYYLTVHDMKKDYPFDLFHVPRSKVWLPDELCNAELDILEQQRFFLSLQKQTANSQRKRDF